MLLMLMWVLMWVFSDKGSFIKMRIYSEPDSQAKTQSQ